MRWCGRREPNGKAIAWKILSADNPLTLEAHLRTPLVYDLTPEQRRLSVHEIWPHPAMVRELARGWTPEREEDLRILDDAVEGKKRAKDQSGQDEYRATRHCFYFPKKRDAEAASKRLRDLGFSVQVRRSASGKDWLTLAERDLRGNGEKLAGLRDDMEAVAYQFGGEYDGWEAPID